MQQLKVSKENSYTIGWKAVKNTAFNSALVPRVRLWLKGAGYLLLRPAGSREQQQQRNHSSTGVTTYGNHSTEASETGDEVGRTARHRCPPCREQAEKKRGKRGKRNVTLSAVTHKELSAPPCRQHVVEHCVMDDHLLFSYRFICWHWMFLVVFFNHLDL